MRPSGSGSGGRAALLLGLFCGTVLLSSGAALGEEEPQRGAGLYDALCAACHGADRLGGTGPALLPENLGRLSREDAYAAIADGLPATQMPGFGHALDDAEIQSLVALIYTPLDYVPEWRLEDIADTWLVHVGDEEQLATEPQFDADPENIFLVVETGDHHVTVLDGDRFVPIHRFKSRHALHGGPKYSPDGRFVFLASRDGWISRFDLYNLRVTHEIRAGINTRNVALSADGRYVLVGNYLPHTLVVLDSRDLSPLQRIPVTDAAGERTSRVSAVYQAAPRGSFIAALRDVPEIWELFYDPANTPAEAEPLSGAPGDGQFAVRRIRIDDPMDDFFFEPEYRRLLGAARDAGRSVAVDLDAGREIGIVPIDGMPHLASGITWEYRGRTVMATPHLREAAVSVVDMDSWEVIRRIETKGPGFFLRSHENSRYAWVDVFFGPNRDLMHVIDKETLDIVKTLRPEAGKTAAHVEFTRDGSHALVSIWDMDGALVIYDAETLEEVKRLPMRRPSGKYNVSNKIYRSPGTSH
ncbi:MAG: c-type cytochrome [Ectothiorhodospiraceae bacterium]|nr:c-type cytochrome [Ectothiorhodospiraceae bacterium]